LVTSLQLLAELPPELAPLQLSPRRPPPRAVFRLGALLLASAAVQALEIRVHLHGVPVALAGVDLDRFPEHVDQLGP